jgi:hypothetical protein
MVFTAPFLRHISFFFLLVVSLQYNTAQTTTVMGKAERMETALGNVSTSQELNDKYQEFVAGGK